MRLIKGRAENTKIYETIVNISEIHLFIRHFRWILSQIDVNKIVINYIPITIISTKNIIKSQIETH